MSPSYLFGLTGLCSIPYSSVVMTLGNHALLFQNADNNFFFELMGKYGLYAVFFLSMWEGDATLLVAGVLAVNGVFGSYGFAKVLVTGTVGGTAGDCFFYGLGRGFERGVRRFRFYKLAAPRLVRLVEKYGTFSIFIVKYIFGLRMAACVFYGVGRMPLVRFILLTLGSCGAWALVLSGAGYTFSGAITKMIGNVKTIGLTLLIILAVGIIMFYLIERFWLSKKVEEVDPERLKELEILAQEKIHGLKVEVQGLKEGLQERIHLPHLHRRKDSAATHEQPTSERGETGGD
jgi:membrane protein DedA with SNARE-associated domain